MENLKSQSSLTKSIAFLVCLQSMAACTIDDNEGYSCDESLQQELADFRDSVVTVTGPEESCEAVELILRDFEERITALVLKQISEQQTSFNPEVNLQFVLKALYESGEGNMLFSAGYGDLFSTTYCDFDSSFLTHPSIPKQDSASCSTHFEFSFVADNQGDEPAYAFYSAEGEAPNYAVGLVYVD